MAGSAPHKRMSSGAEHHQDGPPVAKRGHKEDDISIFGASQYTKRRAVREHYQARLAKIEYEERVAKLTPWMAFG